ncbi:MAG: ATP-grasp domain-containing protein [Bacteroidales bacterium]|nr:ATP-grasp domain-containing protein [Bacteroidales bacterium]
MFDVILTDADNPVGRQVRADLERHGLSVYMYPHTVLDGNWVEKVLRFAVEQGCPMVIPIFYADKLSAIADRFPSVKVPVDKVGNILKLDDKVSACALAASLGIPQPEIYIGPGAAGIDNAESYPVVFKRASGHGGDSVYFPKNRETLEHLMASSVEGSYIVQRHIAGGREVSVDAIRWDGHFFAAAYEVLLPQSKGASVMRRSIVAPELCDYARRMLDAVGYRGVCGFDFIDGLFLECNPRFSGGVGSQIASGFDQPWMLYCAASGREVETPSFHPGRLTRSRRGSLEYLRTRIRRKKLNLRDVVLCLLTPVSALDRD